MKMTKLDAMNLAINLVDEYLNLADVTPEQEEKLTKAREIYVKQAETLSKPRTPMAEEKAKELSAQRKAATAAARAELIAEVTPVLRKYLVTDVTAKELFEAAKDELPADFTSNKVQNILIREMKSELVRTERKKGGDTYRLA